MDNNHNQYHTHITSHNKWYELNLKETWKYKDLIILFTKRNFILKYKQTILGPAWLFINPLLSSLIYTFVFGGIAGMSTDGVPHLLFYLSSGAIWTLFSFCLTQNATAFTSNANVFGKVYFPRLTIPFSTILSAILQFAIQMIIVVVFLVYYIFKGAVSPNYYLFTLVPFILVHIGIMGMGVGIIISSLTTKYRDLTILVSFGVQLWMYATPVLYPLSQLNNGKLRLLMILNPVSAPVELFRYALLGKGTVMPGGYMYSLLFTVVVAIFGIMIFNHVEKTFMDTV